jgi:hypothetical protein
MVGVALYSNLLGSRGLRELRELQMLSQTHDSKAE